MEKEKKKMSNYGIVEEKEKERRAKIESSNYNRWYKRIKSEDIPEYLKERTGRR